MERITESPSLYRNLEYKATLELLTDINTEDQKVALAVQKSIDQIAPLIDTIADKMKNGGRLFYIGAGTSGRLGVLDASEWRESEKERDVEIETTFETKGTKQEQEGFNEEDPSPSLFSEEREDPDKIDETERIRVNGKDKTKDEFQFHLTEEDKDLFWFEKPPVSLLFDYKRWNRQLRYIKNYRFEHAVRNELSQYFFYPCQSDGKRRISFTYPSSLSAFFEMLRQKMYFSFFTTKKSVCDELDQFFYDELHHYYCWIYTNEKKWRSLRNEFRDRIEALDRGSPYLDVLEKKTRLCNNKTKEPTSPCSLPSPVGGGSRMPSIQYRRTGWWRPR